MQEVVVQEISLDGLMVQGLSQVFNNIVCVVKEFLHAVWRGSCTDGLFSYDSQGTSLKIDPIFCMFMWVKHCIFYLHNFSVSFLHYALSGFHMLM